MKSMAVPFQSCRHLVVIVGEIEVYVYKIYMSEILLQDTMLS